MVKRNAFVALVIMMLLSCFAGVSSALGLPVKGGIPLCKTSTLNVPLWLYGYWDHVDEKGNRDITIEANKNDVLFLTESIKGSMAAQDNVSDKIQVGKYTINYTLQSKSHSIEFVKGNGGGFINVILDQDESYIYIKSSHCFLQKIDPLARVCAGSGE